MNQTSNNATTMATRPQILDLGLPRWGTPEYWNLFQIDDTTASTASASASAAPKSKTQPQKERKEEIYSYEDGSVYMGEMVNNKKDGRGTLRTPAFIYGAMVASDDAEANMQLVRWHEYIGEWVDDVMHGRGKHVMMRGNGSQNVLYDGVWDHGVHKAQAHYD